MTISMYKASAQVFLLMLPKLSAMLEKAQAHAAARKIDPAVLVNARLYPDMFPLARQVQIAADFAKGACGRLAGAELPVYPDNESTFDELKARVAKTIDFVRSLKPAQIDDSEERDVTITVRNEPRVLKGEPYLLDYALPNFFFHMTTAYAILRHCGVELGKADFVVAPKGR